MDSRRNRVGLRRARLVWICCISGRLEATAWIGVKVATAYTKQKAPIILRLQPSLASNLYSKTAHSSSLMSDWPFSFTGRAQKDLSFFPRSLHVLGFSGRNRSCDRCAQCQITCLPHLDITSDSQDGQTPRSFGSACTRVRRHISSRTMSSCNHHDLIVFGCQNADLRQQLRRTPRVFENLGLD